MKDAYYKSRYIFDPKRNIVWKEIVRFLDSYIKNAETVLDLGAGYCDFINNVSATKKYAVDISPELSNYAGKEVIQINRTGWDFYEIPNESVDVVHASNFLEHFTDENLEKIMKEVKRILKKGGKLILMQPNYRYSSKTYFDDPTHKKVFSDTALESFLISYDFEIIRKMPKFLPFSLKSRPSIIPLSPLFVRAYIHSPWKPFAGQMLFVSKNQ